MAGSLFFAARIIFTRRSYALPKGGEAVARLRGAAALLFPVFFGAALLFFPDVSAAAAREGVTLCLQTVLPSLFPFFVLSSLLVQSDVPRLLSRAMAGVMYPLFGVSGAGASALILGLLGGYPVGARTVAELYGRGEIAREEAEQLLAFCNNSGPGFFLGVCGTAVFGSARAGMYLYLIHVGAALVTGTTVGLLMSPLTAYWVPVLASAFAVVVVKLPFGGTGRNLFNPAAAGMALATQCFPTRVFTYPDIAAMDGSLPLGALPEGFVTRLSPAAELAAGAKANFSFSDLLWGKISGPIGATAVLVLVAAALFLFLRRTASPSVTLPFLAVCVIISVLFPRSDEGSFKYNMALEICSGYLLFAGIFMLNDPVTSPRHTSARIVYGVLAGILTMLLRHFGRFEEGTCFAVLLMNAFAAPIDRGCWYFSRFLRERRAVKRGERA